jgi:3-phosphoshikimate 1-carboxyvinyltransferase
MRFGSCLSLVADGPLVMDGDSRMRERPIGPLGAALEKLGVQVEYLGVPGCPPIRLRRVSDTPGEVGVDSSLSSQFASGLMLVAPGLAKGLRVILEGDVVSTPYINMTARMMLSAGAAVEWDGGRVVSVSPGGYRAGVLRGTIAVEPDWSGAAFMLAAAFVTALELGVEGLAPPRDSLQGDSEFAGYLEELKKRRIHAFDLTGTPDLIAPLAAAALFARDITKIRGAAHTRVKESDRIAILTGGFRRIGARITEHPDGMDIEPLGLPTGGSHALETANDHRMAMAFGVVSLRVPGVEVLQKECVSKYFPVFWKTLEEIKVMDKGGRS